MAIVCAFECINKDFVTKECGKFFALLKIKYRSNKNGLHKEIVLFVNDCGYLIQNVLIHNFNLIQNFLIFLNKNYLLCTYSC